MNFDGTPAEGSRTFQNGVWERGTGELGNWGTGELGNWGTGELAE